MSAGWLLLLYLVGLALVLTEIALPGVVLGLVGLGCLGVALYFTFSIYGIWSGLGAAAAIALGLGAASYIALRRLRMDTTLDAARGYSAADPRLAALEGKQGVADSPLRPAGVATIEGRRVDVVTRGELIEPGALAGAFQQAASALSDRVVVEAI